MAERGEITDDQWLETISPRDSRFVGTLLGSTQVIGTLGGYSLGAGLVTLMTVLLSDSAMHAWGWRVPFLCAAPLGLFGLYLRLKLEDSAAFTSASEQGDTSRTPLREIITENTRRMLQCIGLVVLFNVAYYTVLTYLPSYFEKHLGFSNTGSLELLIAVYIGMMIVIAFIGRLSDRIGRKPVIMTSAIGGTAPFVISALIGATGNTYMPAFYLMLAAAVALPTLLTIRETAGQPLAGSSGLRGTRSR